MSILSSVFSILAPQRPVNYDAMWRVIDTMQNRADKKRDEELAARANVNDIAAKFGAKITGLPNDARATRQKFEELYLNFKLDFEEYASSGYASHYTGSIVSLNHINELQKIETDIYHNTQRENEYNSARSLVTQSGNLSIIPYAAIKDMALNTSTILQSFEPRITDELSFSEILKMYANNDNYTKTDMNSLIEASRIDPKEAIKYFSQLLSLAGNVTTDNYNEILNQISAINNSASVPEDQKKKLNNLILTRTQSNRYNLDWLETGINSGTLMTPDMALAIKTGILGELVFNEDPNMDNIIDKNKAKELYNKTEEIYKTELKEKINTLANIALITNTTKNLPNGSGVGDINDDAITLAKQYVHSHSDNGTSATLTYNTRNDGESTISILTSNTSIPKELNEYLTNTNANTPIITVSIRDVDDKVVKKGAYEYDESNSELNNQFYEQAGFNVKDIYTGDVVQPNNIQFLISGLTNNVLSIDDNIYTQTNSNYSKNELEQLFFYGLTNFSIDTQEPKNNGVLEFNREFKNAKSNNYVKIDFLGSKYLMVMNELLNNGVINMSEKNDAVTGMPTPTQYASYTDEQKVKYHNELYRLINYYAIKKGEPIAYNIYNSKGGKKITFDDIVKALGATQNTDNTYKLTYYSNTTQNLLNSEIQTEDKNRKLLDIKQ
jgi:hypothetical protein